MLEWFRHYIGFVTLGVTVILGLVGVYVRFDERLSHLEGQFQILATQVAASQSSDAGVADGGPDAGACPAGYADCDRDPGTECDSLATEAHCGACEVHCALLSGAGDYVEQCLSTSTGYACNARVPAHTRAASCEPGWYDCNGAGYDGCESEAACLDPWNEL